MGWSKTMIEIREVPGSSPAWERFFQPCCYPQSTVNLWPDTRGTLMQLMGSFSALMPVVVRLAHSPPPLGAASATRVYRVLAAVVSSLREREFPSGTDTIITLFLSQKSKISPVVNFEVLSRMILVRGS